MRSLRTDGLSIQVFFNYKAQRKAILMWSLNTGGLLSRFHCIHVHFQTLVILVAFVIQSYNSIVIWYHIQDSAAVGTHQQLDIIHLR